MRLVVLLRQGNHFNLEWRESVPVEEFAVLFLAVGDRDHFTVVFQDSVALFHASKDGRQKVLLAK